ILNFVKDDLFGAVRPNVGNPLAKEALGLDATLRQFLEAAEPKLAKAFANQPKVEARLRCMLGTMYRFGGDLVRGLSQDERAYVLAREHLQADPDFLPDVEWTIANTKMLLGKRDEASEFLEKALAQRRKALGNDHPQTLRTLWCLQIHYQLSGDQEAC